MVDYRDDPVELVQSRHGAWRERFAAERDRLRRALADAGVADHVERVEHVGSTAVPGLAAKDIVDVDVVVADGAVGDVSDVIERTLGGTRAENSDTWHPVFREANGQRFNDHVFAASSPRWKVSVATREALRARPALRAEYERVKRGLTAEYDDVDAYSGGKTEVIERVLAVARGCDDVALSFAVPTLQE